MPIPKEVSEPLGFVSYALSLVFGIAGREISKKGSRSTALVVAAYAMAAVCIAGGLFISLHKPTDSENKTASAKPTSSSQSAPDSPPKLPEPKPQSSTTINQQSCQGTNVAFNSGTVIVAGSQPSQPSKTSEDCTLSIGDKAHAP